MVTRKAPAELRGTAPEVRAAVLADQQEALVEVLLDGTVTCWTPGAERLYGFGADEMLGKPLTGIFPASKLAEPAALLARVARGERIPQFETLRVAKDGRALRVLVTYDPVRDPEGAIVGMRALARPAANKRSAFDIDTQLSAIVESSDDAIISKRIDGMVMSWNPAAERMFGYSAAEMIGRPITRIFPRERASEEDLLLTSIARGERVVNFETVRVRKDGTELSVAVTMSPLRDVRGRIVGVSKIVRDVTERQRMVSALADQGERYRVTLQSIADGVIATDPRGNVEFLNPVAERLTGWMQADAVGRPIEQVFHVVREHDGPPAPNPVRICLHEQRPVAQAERSQLISRTGASMNVENSAAPIVDAQGDSRGAVLVFRDLSEQRRMANEMSYRASHDPLTNLLNRAAFETRLNQALAERGKAGDHSLVYIDLDQFKLINDALGHAVGDRLLQQIAGLVQSRAGARDVCARVGGDEFAILLYGRDIERARALADQVCDTIEDFRFAHEERHYRVGASIGLVPLDAQWNCSAAALQAAEAACGAAKEEGRHRVHPWFDTDSARQQRQGESGLVARLTEAIETDRLVLFAQRVACADVKALPQLEILVRLPDGNGGFISPSRFLAAAERFQLASRVDRWVIRTVFAWIAQNAAALERFSAVSVNLTGHAIGDRAFHRQVLDALAAQPAAAAKICVEFAEPQVVANLADAVEFMAQLHGRGARVTIDDFGTACSYFSTLKSMPVDFLKFDRHFVQDIVRDPINQAAVRCFCSIARSIGAGTIAKGVETRAASQALREAGVEYVQGYVVHRPEPLALATSVAGESAAPVDSAFK